MENFGAEFSKYQRLEVDKLLIPERDAESFLQTYDIAEYQTVVKPSDTRKQFRRLSEEGSIMMALGKKEPRTIPLPEVSEALSLSRESEMKLASIPKYIQVGNRDFTSELHDDLKKQQ